MRLALSYALGNHLIKNETQMLRAKKIVFYQEKLCFNRRHLFCWIEF